MVWLLSWTWLPLVSLSCSLTQVPGPCLGISPPAPDSCPLDGHPAPAAPRESGVWLCRASSPQTLLRHCAMCAHWSLRSLLYSSAVARVCFPHHTHPVLTAHLWLHLPTPHLSCHVPFPVTILGLGICLLKFLPVFPQHLNHSTADPCWTQTSARCEDRLRWEGRLLLSPVGTDRPAHNLGSSSCLRAQKLTPALGPRAPAPARSQQGRAPVLYFPGEMPGVQSRRCLSVPGCPAPGWGGEMRPGCSREPLALGQHLHAACLLTPI